MKANYKRRQVNKESEKAYPEIKRRFGEWLRLLCEKPNIEWKDQLNFRYPCKS